MVKVFAIFGLIYLTIGLFDLKHSFGDSLYRKVWGFDPPDRYYIMGLGLQLLLLEVLIDAFLYIMDLTPRGIFICIMDLVPFSR